MAIKVNNSGWSVKWVTQAELERRGRTYKTAHYHWILCTPRNKEFGLFATVDEARIYCARHKDSLPRYEVER